MEATSPPIKVGGITMPHKEWALLNRFRPGVAICNYLQSKLFMTLEPLCYCGEECQTMNHICCRRPYERRRFVLMLKR